MTDFRWHYEGRAWVFGDDVSVDGDLMPLRFALSRETRPEVLREHLFAGIDPDFPSRASAGDIIIAGRRFAQGNPHIQGLLGIKGAGLGLVAESIPSGSLRNAINAGLAVLPHCPHVRNAFSAGDRIAVDFATGTVENLSSGWVGHYPPLPPTLRDFVEAGDWSVRFRARLRNQGDSGKG